MMNTRFLADANELCRLGVRELTAGFSSGRFTPLEVAQATLARAEQVQAHDDDGHERVRSGEGHVVGDADVLVHDVAEELCVARKRRNDVVAERQCEREDGAGDDTGQSERQDHAPKCRTPLGPEIAGRLDQ